MPTTTTLPTGEIVVPMSTLLDALSSVLSPAERDALFENLLALRPQDVAPGDLITADLFNQILRDINDLMLRVARIEGNTGGPVIDQIEPGDTDLPTGSRIKIRGRNLKPANADTKVSFGSIEVFDFFPESSDITIELPVPVGFASLPASINVHVTTGGKVSNDIGVRIVEPTVVATGVIVIHSQGGGANADGTFTLQWRIISQLNVARIITLQKRVNAITGGTPGAWLDNIELSDAGPFELQPGASHDVTMTVKVPAGASEASVSLFAQTTDGGFATQATPIVIKAGAPLVTSDPRAVLNLATIIDSATLAKTIVSVDGQNFAGFKMTPSKTANLKLNLATTAAGAGFFAFEVKVEPGSDDAGTVQTGRWTPGAMSATRLPLGGPQTQPVTVPMTSSAIADTKTVAWLVISASCFAAASGGTAKFNSFTRVPIVGL